MSMKNKVQRWLSSINTKTGITNTTLKAAIQTLIDGYGGSKESKYFTTMSFSESSINEDIEIDFANYPSLGNVSYLFRNTNVNGHKISLINCRFTNSYSLLAE